MTKRKIKIDAAHVSHADSYADGLILYRNWGHDEALRYGLELAAAAERDVYPDAWNRDWPKILKVCPALRKREFTGLVAIRLLERAPRLMRGIA